MTPKPANPPTGEVPIAWWFPSIGGYVWSTRRSVTRWPRACRVDGRQGHVYLAAVLYELIENECLEAFTRQWLEGAIEL